MNNNIILIQNNFFKEKYYKDFRVNLHEIYDPETHSPLNVTKENFVLNGLVLDDSLEKSTSPKKSNKNLAFLNEKYTELMFLQRKNQELQKKVFLETKQGGVHRHELQFLY